MPSPGADLGTPVRVPALPGPLPRYKALGSGKTSAFRGEAGTRTPAGPHLLGHGPLPIQADRTRAPMGFPTRGHLKGATRSVDDAEPVSSSATAHAADVDFSDERGHGFETYSMDDASGPWRWIRPRASASRWGPFFQLYNSVARVYFQITSGCLRRPESPA